MGSLEKKRDEERYISSSKCVGRWKEKRGGLSAHKVFGRWSGFSTAGRSVGEIQPYVFYHFTWISGRGSLTGKGAYLLLSQRKKAREVRFCPMNKQRRGEDRSREEKGENGANAFAVDLCKKKRGERPARGFLKKGRVCRGGKGGEVITSCLRKKGEERKGALSISALRKRPGCQGKGEMQRDYLLATVGKKNGGFFLLVVGEKGTPDPPPFMKREGGGKVSCCLPGQG